MHLQNDTADSVWDSARRQVKDGRLSIIMPAHNLGHAIAQNVVHVRDLFAGQLPFEIIVVDDGSTDNTRSELNGMAVQINELKLVMLDVNSGKGEALRRGFACALGNYVLLLDGDLDLPPIQAAGFFSIMEQQKADVVIGSKRHKDSILQYPLSRKIVSNIYYLLIKILVGLPVKDTQTGIKLFKREVLEWVFPRMLVKRFAFDLEILTIAHEKGYRVAEAPITLEFKGDKWGCLRPSTIHQIMNDTLAIFYRAKILKYYQRLDVDSKQ